MCKALSCVKSIPGRPAIASQLSSNSPRCHFSPFPSFSPPWWFPSHRQSDTCIYTLVQARNVQHDIGSRDNKHSNYERSKGYSCKQVSFSFALMRQVINPSIVECIDGNLVHSLLAHGRKGSINHKQCEQCQRASLTPIFTWRLGFLLT